LRSAGAGQKTSSIVRVLGAPEVPVADELLLVLLVEVLVDLLRLDRETYATAATTIRTITIAATTVRPTPDLRLGKNCKA
jgi:hypothetical protein